MSNEGKGEFLQENGYKYNYKLRVYFSLENKMVFSIEVIEKNSLNWLKEKINKSERGKIYFTEKPPNYIRKRIAQELFGEHKGV